MSNYITRQYLETFISADQISALLSYGNTSLPVSASIQDAKMDQLISSSCDMIDSFLVPAGYDLPLNINPPSIQRACSFLVIQDLYGTANQPIPESLSYNVKEAYGFLNMLKSKELILPGLTQNPNTGEGANLFSLDSASSTGGGISANPPARLLSVQKLWGTFL